MSQIIRNEENPQPLIIFDLHSKWEHTIWKAAIRQIAQNDRKLAQLTAKKDNDVNNLNRARFCNCVKRQIITIDCLAVAFSKKRETKTEKNRIPARLQQWNGHKYVPGKRAHTDFN